MKLSVVIFLAGLLSVSAMGPGLSECDREGYLSHDRISGRCHRYVKCEKGWEVLQTCLRSGTVFSAEAQGCVDKSEVLPPCGTRTTTTRRSPTTEPSICLELYDGLYGHPDGKCDEYMSCVNGTQTIIQCEGEGLVWNYAAKRCVDPSLTPPPCGTYRPPTTPRPFSCRGRAPGNYPTRHRCSTSFYQCHQNRLPKSSKCSSGLVFSGGKCIPLQDCL